MKQVLFNKNGRVFVEEVPIPATDDNSVLVNNVCSVISSGTEKSMIELMKKPLAKMAMERMDLTKQVIDYAKNAGIKKTLELVRSRLDTWHLLGYSSAGYVVKAGKYAVNLGKYDRVACVGSGFANHSEFVNVPHTFVERIPNNVSFKEASFTGVAAIALQSVRQLNPQLGQTVVVVGLGLLGGIIAQILKANGCVVIGIDVDPSKLKKDYIDYAAIKGTASDVMKITNNNGADGVIIAASSKSNLVDSSFDMCKKKGTVVLLGVCGLNIDREKMFAKELEFKISTAFGLGSFDYDYINGKSLPMHYVRWNVKENMKSVLQLMSERKLKVEDLIEAEIEIDSAKKAYDKILKGEVGVGLIKYKDVDEKYLEKKRRSKKEIQIDSKVTLEEGTKESKVDKSKEKINVGIIGAGNFVKAFIIPHLKKIKGYKVYAVATKSGASAKKTAVESGAKYATTNYMDLINDKHVDLVIIGTRHNSHAKLAEAAIKAGKHVYVEKPLALNKKEYISLKKEIEKAEKKNKDQVITVGFNRRYSDTFVKVKSLLNPKKAKIINYVFNNSYIPKDSWVNDPESGGLRVLGECCHIIDLFNYLTESKPLALEAYKVSSEVGKVNDENNIVATLRYEDGSVCNLVYSCMGTNKMEKESCKIFEDGNVIDTANFRKVHKNGKLVFKGAMDEGHYNQMTALRDKILKKENPLEVPTKSEILNATEITFNIYDKIKG